MSIIDIKQKLLINYIYITIGSFLLAFGVVGFLIPNKIATGGTAGLAIIFHFLFNLPTGIMMAVINIPLLLVSIKYLGKIFALNTSICIVLTAIFVDILAEVVQLPCLSDESLLATLYGGIVIGVGLGLVFKGGASAGGGTILAKMITTRFEVKTGTVTFVLDAIVVCSIGLLFQNVELALWSMISIFATSKLIDIILMGSPTEKIVHISSFQKLDDLCATINKTLDVSGTIVSGKDLKLAENKDIIFIVIEKSKLTALKYLVTQCAPDARMIVMEASEMLGGK